MSDPLEFWPGPPGELQSMARSLAADLTSGGIVTVQGVQPQADFNFDFNFQIPTGMRFETIENPGSGELQIEFACPRCDGVDMAEGLGLVPSTEEIGNITILLAALETKHQYDDFKARLMKMKGADLARLAMMADKIIAERDRG